MNNKLFEQLENDLNLNTNEDLQQKLEEVHNKKFVFTFNLISLLLLIVIIYNSISSALLGLPPLGMVAMIDHSGSILMLLERVSLSFVAIVTTIPFFNMLVFDKLGKNLSKTDQKNRADKITGKGKDINETMDGINGILIALAIIAASYFIVQAIMINISFLLIAAASIIAVYLLQKIIHQVVIEYHLGNHGPGNVSGVTGATNVNMLTQLQFSQQPEKTEKAEKTVTIELVETAVKKLSYVSFSTVSNKEVYQSLVTTLYQAQLARALKAHAASDSKDVDNAVNEIKLAAAGPGIYDKLSCIDDKVAESAVYTSYVKLLKNKGDKEGNDKIQDVIRAKHKFRTSMIEYLRYDDPQGLFDTLLNDCTRTEYIFKSGLISELCKNIDTTDEAIKQAILAEIAEEQMLLYSDGISAKLQTKLFKERLAARDELDTEIAKTLGIAVKNKGLAEKVGWWLGNVNALVNGVIIAAVTSNILSSILPALLLGFAVSSPILLYVIMAVAFASGWYASFSITKDAVEDICKNLDHIRHKNQLLQSNQTSYNNLSTGGKLGILLAAIGVGILTGIQVFHMLLPLGLTLAIVSSIFIAGMTVVAGGSLFIKFIDKVLQEQKEKASFLELHFSNENDKQSRVTRAENISYAISIVLGIAATVLIWSNMHIFAFAVLTGMTTFLVAEIFATVIVNKYCVDKPPSNWHIAREVCGKVAIFATALCAMCFFMSTFVTITALVSGNVGIILAIITALCIAYLYSQYVWSAGASPDVYWQKSLPSVQNNAAQAKTADALSKAPDAGPAPGVSDNTNTQQGKTDDNVTQKQGDTSTGKGFSLLGCLGW